MWPRGLVSVYVYIVRPGLGVCTSPIMILTQGVNSDNCETYIFSTVTIT